MKESTIVEHIMNGLKAQYPGFYFKTHGGLFQRAGLPDILGVHKGRFIGIEVKLPGKENTLTWVQARTIRKIKMAGGISFMSTSWPQTLEYMRKEGIHPWKG